MLLLVPTGIGATIGGYAGDALPVARAVSTLADVLITHPNVLNGAQLYWPLCQTLYVEGYGLDQFAAGHWGLQPVHQNRVGLLLDQAIEPELRVRHLQAADAVRATLGITLTEAVITDQPLGVELRLSESGASWGTLNRPDSLLRGAKRLIEEAKADAIAVISRFPDDPSSFLLQQYRQGQGVDALAGAEAVISHLIVRQFQIPCAHAPALDPLPLELDLSPKAAAEEIGYTFLPCVLVGLSRAPQFLPAPGPTPGIWANQVDAVVVPATACGSSAILSLCQQTQTRIIAVEENQTQMRVKPEALGIRADHVHSYLEALGVLAAHKAGINPGALRSTLPPLTVLSSATL